MSYFWNKSGLVFAGALAVGAFSDRVANAEDVKPDGTLATTGVVSGDATGANVAGSAPTDAQGIALRAAILAETNLDSAVHDFYAARGFRAFWLETPARANGLRAALATAPEHALPPGHYNVPPARVGVAATDPVSAAQEEIALTRAYLVFAGDVAAGVLQPRSLDREIHIFPERPSVATLLLEAKLSGDARKVIADVEPSHPHYARAREMMITLNAIIDGGDWGPTVGEGGSLKLGMTGPRVAALRARLTAMRDMVVPIAPVDAADENATRVIDDVYDAALEGGCHGLSTASWAER